MFWIDEFACVLFFVVLACGVTKFSWEDFTRKNTANVCNFFRDHSEYPSCKLPGRPCKVAFPKGSFVMLNFGGCTKRTPRLKMIQTLETWGPIGGSTLHWSPSVNKNCKLHGWKMEDNFLFAFLNPFLGGGWNYLIYLCSSIQSNCF